MLENIIECEPEELESQLRYLDSTPVSGIAQLLRSGKCLLSKGIVTSLQALGDLKTEFSQIGPLIPSSITGQGKFIVSEIVQILRANPDVKDDGLLQSIEALIEKETNDEIDFNITLFKMNEEFIIKDGNKRTIAFFENRRHLNQDNIRYEVYLVNSINYST